MGLVLLANQDGKRKLVKEVCIFLMCSSGSCKLLWSHSSVFYQFTHRSICKPFFGLSFLSLFDLSNSKWFQRVFKAKSIMTSIVDFVYIYLPLTLNAVRKFLLGIAFSWILFKILYKRSPNNYAQSNVISKKSKTIHLEEYIHIYFRVVFTIFLQLISDLLIILLYNRCIVLWTSPSDYISKVHFNSATGHKFFGKNRRQYNL